MTIQDGIAGVLRRNASHSSVRAETSALLAAMCGPTAVMALHAMEHTDVAIALGVARHHSGPVPGGLENSLSRSISQDCLALSGVFDQAAQLATDAPHDRLADVLAPSARALRDWRGAFACALWRPAERSLTLTRDHFGQRPLYYCNIENGIAFSSTLRSLVSTGLTSRRINPAAIEVYLFNGFMVSPLTLVDGVHSVMPSESITLSAGDASTRSVFYWSYPRADAAQHGPNRYEHVERVRPVFEAALTRAAADAKDPAAFLSGGLDSSLIVTAAQRLFGKVSTLSVGMSVAEYDESEQADWIAQRHSSRHILTKIQRTDLESSVETVITAMDQPSHDGFNMFFAARSAAENGMNVVLSGLGGDELFGGYPDIAWLPSLARADNFIAHMPSTVKNASLRVLGNEPFRIGSAAKLAEMFNHPSDGIFPPNGHFMRSVLAAYQTLYMVFPQWSRTALTRPQVNTAARSVYFGLPQPFVNFCDSINADGDVAAAIFRLNSVLFLSERVLRDTDAIASSQGVHVSVPLINVDFVESMWSVPVASRAGNKHTKPFQLELLRAYVQDDFPLRKKRGFVLPFEIWMRDGNLQQQLLATFGDAGLAASIGLESEAINRLHRNFMDRTLPIPWHSVWSLFVLLRWCAQLDLAL